MCGICGLIGPNINYDEMEAFEELFYISQVRGSHSYGLFTYTSSGSFKNEPYRLDKDAIPVSEFLIKQKKIDRNKRMIRSIFTELYMGHARYATVGEINRKNAHPFAGERYVGTHNGTIRDSGFYVKGKTDSQILFEKIENEGIVPVLSSISPSSAYAVSIFDKKNKTVTLARNSRRPLFIGISKVTGSLFYASELTMLHFISSRARESGWKVDMDFFKLEPLKAYEVKISECQRGNMTPWLVHEVGEKKIEKIPLPEIDYDLSGKYGIREWNAFDNYEFCSSCGEILDDTTLHTSEKWSAGDSTFFTCRECVKSTKRMVRSGPKISVGH